MNPKKKMVIGSPAEYVRKFFDGENGFTSEQFEELLSLPFPDVAKVIEKLGIASGIAIRTRPIVDWNSWSSVAREPVIEGLEKRLRWELVRLHRNSTVLNQQLESRAKLENLLLEESFETLKSKLTIFETRFGVSLWSLAFKFRVAQLENGSDFNRTELMVFIESEKNNRRRSWSNFLAQMFSNQTDELLTSNDYAESVHYLRANDQQLGEYSLNYLRFRLLSEQPKTEKAIVDVLHLESRHAILDTYDTLMTILAGRLELKIPDDILEGIAELKVAINDPKISLISCIHDPHSIQAKDHWSFVQAYEASFVGEYARALKLSVKLIEEEPRYFGGYQLTAMCLATNKLEIPDSVRLSGIQKRLIVALCQWYSVESDRKQALELLRRLARFFSGTDLGWSMHVFLESYDGSFFPLCSDRPFLFATPVIIPQHALLLIQVPDRANSLLQAVNEVGVSEASIHAVKLVYDSESDERTWQTEFTSLERRKHLEAVVAARRERYTLACSSLQSLRIEFPAYYFSRPETQILEANCLFEIEQYEEAARLTGQLYASNPNAVPPAQLRRFKHIIADETMDVAADNICWAIIAEALRRNEDNSISLDRVHDFVSDYIESQGFELPTQLLRENLETLDAVQFAFFRDCCRPEIMESSIWIENQQELFGERLELCEKIRDNHGQPLGIEGEIGLLMRKLAVIDISNRIERSKIFVDCEKIAERIPDSLKDTIRRLLTIVALSNNEIRQGLKLLGMPDREGGKLLVVKVDGGLELFRNLFLSLREQYLFSPELGLDANLSQSIRHGPIISGIRSIFDKAKFVTRKTSDGAYAENTYWAGILGGSSTEQSLIQGAFSQFSQDVDQFIHFVRSEAIQISSIECTTGLFEFEFSDSQLLDVFKQIEPFHEVDDVVMVVLNALKIRTKKCLIEIQKRIREDWNSNLLQCLHVLKEQIEYCVQDQARLAPFRTSFTDCGTEIPRGLEKLAVWFAQEDARTHKPFPIKSLFQSFENIARKSGQNCSTKYVGTLESEDPYILGAYFRPFWDLFFNLFDNALKHSGLENVLLKIEFAVSEEGTLVRVANPLAQDFKIDELTSRVEQLNALSLDRESDLSKLRLEGGSGIAKLHKIVRHEIGDNIKDYTINFQLSTDHEFVATLQFPVKVCQ